MRPRLVLTLVLCVASAVPIGACAYDWTFYGSGGADGGADGSVDTGRPEFDASAGDSTPPPPGPPPGDCDATRPCSPGSFCQFANRDCGKSGAGKCLPSAQPCPATPGSDYACGCDGQTYDSVCTANAKGQDTGSDGRCTPPDATFFQCGYRFCRKATQYCEVIKGPPAEFKCPPLCVKLDCSCPPTTCMACSGTADGGGITATCP